MGLALAYWAGIPLAPRLLPEALHVGLGLAGVLPLLLLFAWAQASAWPPMRRLRTDLSTSLTVLFEGARWPEVLVVSLLAGWGEELLFRGVLQQWLAPRIGQYAALGLAAVLFGLVHSISIVYLIGATLAGLFFGWLYLWTGSLLVPIIADGGYDWIAITIVLNRSERGVTSQQAGGGD